MPNPNQLAAFANPNDMAGEDMTDDQMAEPVEPEGANEESLAQLTVAMAHNREELQDLVDEVDASILDDPSAELTPEDEEALREALDMIPPDLRKAIQTVSPMTTQDAQFVADELAGFEMVDDAERLAGWLYRMSQMITQPEGFTGEETDTEEEEGMEPEGEEEYDYEQM